MLAKFRVAKEQFLQNVGIRESSTDPVLEGRTQELNALNDGLVRVHEKMGRYYEALKALSDASMDLADELKLFHESVPKAAVDACSAANGGSGALNKARDFAVHVCTMQRHMHEYVLPPVLRVYRDFVWQPTRQLLAQLPRAKALADTQRKRMLDFDVSGRQLRDVTEAGKQPGPGLVTKVQAAAVAVNLAGKNLGDRVSALEARWPLMLEAHHRQLPRGLPSRMASYRTCRPRHAHRDAPHL